MFIEIWRKVVSKDSVHFFTHISDWCYSLSEYILLLVFLYTHVDVYQILVEKQNSNYH